MRNFLQYYRDCEYKINKFGHVCTLSTIHGERNRRIKMYKTLAIPTSLYSSELVGKVGKPRAGNRMSFHGVEKLCTKGD